MIHVPLLVARLLEVILSRAVRLLVLFQCSTETRGAAFGVAEEVSLLSCQCHLTIRVSGELSS